jgi:hypothetical protein
MSVALQEVASLLGLSVQEVEQYSLRAFLEKELRATRLAILAICQKYGVTSWEELNQLIIADTVDEGRILDDFQRVDHLTAKAMRLQTLLEQV